MAERIATVDGADLREFAQPLSTRGAARVERLADNRFKVALTNVAEIRTSQPESSQMCWAACAEMALRADGSDVDQRELVQYFFGGDINERAEALTLVRALSMDRDSEFLAVAREIDGGSGIAMIIQPELVLGRAHSDHLIEELSRGRPVIVGLKERGLPIGHTCVIVGATYAVTQPPGNKLPLGITIATSSTKRPGGVIARACGGDHRKYALESVELIDPDPKADPHRTLDASELKAQAQFLLSSALARAVMDDMIEGARRSIRERKYTTNTFHYEWSLQAGTRRKADR